MRSLSVVEWALAISLGGSVMAVFLPTFIRNVHASRINEPLSGLNRIAQRGTALAAGRSVASAYPESVELTPAKVPAGAPVQDPPGAWDHPTWRRLNFGFSVPHSYSFSFESELPDAAAPQLAQGARSPGQSNDDLLLGLSDPAAPGAQQPPKAVPVARFVAKAFGDLDGDGILSEFEISGESRQGETPSINPLLVYREVE